jgi:hypothetical protein
MFLLSAAALALLLIGAGSAQVASAQHLISSKAGFVNRVEGKVQIQRQESESGEMGRASLGTQMRDGDRLLTEADSRAEVLLSPGVYLRMNEKTAIRALNTEIAEAQFELISGSVIVEVDTIDKKTPLEFLTPQGPVTIAKQGLYRFDAKGDTTTISVQKGELHLGTREQLIAKQTTKVGREKVARLTGSGLRSEIAKLDLNVFDDFDEWSFQRAQTLVAANYSVLRRSGSSRSLAFGWVYDPFYRCYTFIPGRWQLFSPYGFGFYRSLGDCVCYLPYYYPYYRSYGGGTTAGNNNRPSPPTRAVSNSSGDGGRAPIHREIHPVRRVEPAATRAVSQPDFGSSRGYSGGVSAPSSSSSPGRSIDTGRSVDTGAGRSTGGGASSGGGGRPVGGVSRPNN